MEIIQDVVALSCLSLKARFAPPMGTIPFLPSFLPSFSKCPGERLSGISRDPELQYIARLRHLAPATVSGYGPTIGPSNLPTATVSKNR